MLSYRQNLIIDLFNVTYLILTSRCELEITQEELRNSSNGMRAFGKRKFKLWSAIFSATLLLFDHV